MLRNRDSALIVFVFTLVKPSQSSSIVGDVVCRCLAYKQILLVCQVKFHNFHCVILHISVTFTAWKMTFAKSMTRQDKKPYTYIYIFKKKNTFASCQLLTLGDDALDTHHAAKQA